MRNYPDKLIFDSIKQYLSTLTEGEYEEDVLDAITEVIDIDVLVEKYGYEMIARYCDNKSILLAIGEGEVMAWVLENVDLNDYIVIKERRLRWIYMK